MAEVWQSQSWNKQRNLTVSLRMRSTKVNISKPPLPNRSAPFMEEIHVSAECVTKLLKGLNPSKALGPDELHPRFLKKLLDLIESVSEGFSTYSCIWTRPNVCSPLPTIY